MAIFSSRPQDMCEAYVCFRDIHQGWANPWTLVNITGLPNPAGYVTGWGWARPAPAKPAPAEQVWQVTIGLSVCVSCACCHTVFLAKCDHAISVPYQPPQQVPAPAATAPAPAPAMAPAAPEAQDTHHEPRYVFFLFILTVLTLIHRLSICTKSQCCHFQLQQHQPPRSTTNNTSTPPQLDLNTTHTIPTTTTATSTSTTSTGTVSSSNRGSRHVPQAQVRHHHHRCR